MINQRKEDETHIVEIKTIFQIILAELKTKLQHIQKVSNWKEYMTLNVGTFGTQIKVEIPKPDAPQYLFAFVNWRITLLNKHKKKEQDLHYSSLKNRTILAIIFLNITYILHASMLCNTFL